jgi:HSP20 family protein
MFSYLSGSAYPGRHFDNLRRQLDSLCKSDVSFSTACESSSVARRYENESAHVLQMDCPGVTEDNLTIEVSGDTLNIRGDRVIAPPEGFETAETASKPVTFSRAYRLPKTIDAKNVGASLKNGVLTITLPKAEVAKPRTIEVQVN